MELLLPPCFVMISLFFVVVDWTISNEKWFFRNQRWIPVDDFKKGLQHFGFKFFFPCWNVCIISTRRYISCFIEFFSSPNISFLFVVGSFSSPTTSIQNFGELYIQGVYEKTCSSPSYASSPWPCDRSKEIFMYTRLLLGGNFLTTNVTTQCWPYGREGNILEFFGQKDNFSEHPVSAALLYSSPPPLNIV